MDGMIALALLYTSSMLSGPGAAFPTATEQIKENSGALSETKIKGCQSTSFSLCNPLQACVVSTPTRLPILHCKIIVSGKKSITSALLSAVRGPQPRDILHAPEGLTSRAVSHRNFRTFTPHIPHSTYRFVRCSNLPHSSSVLPRPLARSSADPGRWFLCGGSSDEAV